MSEEEWWVSPDLVAVIMLGAGVIVLVLFILIIVLWVKLNRLRRKYVHMMNGGSADNMEELLIQIQERLSLGEMASTQQQNRLSGIEAALRKMKAKVGMHRYNAFGDRGSDQSFSIAIVDEERDGVVLTGIHSRDETYLYAKPLERGQSTYTLSPEEKEAINRSSGS
ncbi:DUF4446 family protein [Paenibacillus koleovorans]|uniref:DUF4446 family protein n=1 Tax=Paenibacillus koleovorans TaxID=121608 RepID=UPI000FDAC035|nr:DUF4446 family protein [Paenibacillus koleovorans]